MSETSQILGLPYIQPAQAQKHVTHNEALRVLDAVVQLTVLNRTLTTPPSTPNTGDRYIVAAGGSGLWAGQDDKIALFDAGTWAFFDPQPGWLVMDQAEAAVLYWDGSTWTAPALDTSVLQNLPQLGVNTTADTTNRLAVASQATLLTHAGSDHRVTVNKNAASDTASLLFQTNWSGRAEMGTAGSDNFEVKVSSDGTAWNTGLSLDPATGKANFPSGARFAQRIEVGGRWYCYADNRWICHNTSYGAQSDNQNDNAGTAAEPDETWLQLGPLLESGTSLRSFTAGFRRSSSEITGFDLRVYFHTGPWGAGWDDGASNSRTLVYSEDAIALGSGFHFRKIDLSGFTAPADGFLLTYLRPVGSLSATRYIYGSMSYAVLTP